MEKVEENSYIEFEYINEKRLGIYDFVESIKTDLTKKISKNRGFINEKFIGFEIWSTNNRCEEQTLFFSVNTKKFDVESLPTDKFVSVILREANDNYREDS